MLPTARKWRPQNFDEVVGQDEVVKALKSAISMGKIGQAYLFSGPRGVGKTTISRILAKSLNCVNGPTPNPCGKCENCVEIKEGRSIDVIEIDGASNRKIDDVRNIREAVKFAPAKSRYKIYIIDEVHMLTDEAFNALLKTLEEPPQHVVFIFATTEPYKVKQTIRSRCQHFVLKPLSIDKIFKQLKRISEAEGYKLTDSILIRIAKAGNGSMRDAESIFDTIISYLGEDVFDEEKIKHIDEEEISKILGIVDISYMETIILQISQKDISNLIKTINTLHLKGIDLRKLVEELIIYFRNLLILKEFGNDRNLIKALDDEIAILERVKDRFSKENITFIQNVLIDVYSEMRGAINELFYLENAMFKIVNPDNVITLSKILEEVKELKKEIHSSNKINFSTSEGSISNFKDESVLQSQSDTSFGKGHYEDPADILLEEISSTEKIPPEELIKQIIAENSAPGTEKKIQINVSDDGINLIMDSFIKSLIEKDLEKIVSKIKSLFNTTNVNIKIVDRIDHKPKSKTVGDSSKPQTVEETIMNLFDAREIKDFTSK